MCMCTCRKERISVRYHIPSKPHIDQDTKDISCPAVFVCWPSGTLRGQPEVHGRDGIKLLISIPTC